MDELELAVERELARRNVPPFNPDYALIGCRGCGRRLKDDDGKRIKLPWWQFWNWGC